MHDCQHLLVVDLVVPLHVREALQHEAYWELCSNEWMCTEGIVLYQGRVYVPDNPQLHHDLVHAHHALLQDTLDDGRHWNWCHGTTGGQGCPGMSPSSSWDAVMISSPRDGKALK